MVRFSAAVGTRGFSSALSPYSKFSLITVFFNICLWVIWIHPFLMLFAMPWPALGLQQPGNVVWPQAITRTPLSAGKKWPVVFRAGGQHTRGCDLRRAGLSACARGSHVEVGVRAHSGTPRHRRPGPCHLRPLTDTTIRNLDTELGFSLQDFSEPLSY